MLTIAPDRMALVTGAASGFGLGVVDRLLEAGARVAMADVSEVLLREEAGGADPRCSPIVLDVRGQGVGRGGRRRGRRLARRARHARPVRRRVRLRRARRDDRGELGPPARHQPQGNVPRRPGGDAAPRRERPRPDGEHRLRGRAKGLAAHLGVQRLEVRRRRPDPDVGPRVRARRRDGQLRLPGDDARRRDRARRSPARSWPARRG